MAAVRPRLFRSRCARFSALALAALLFASPVFADNKTAARAAATAGANAWNAANYGEALSRFQQAEKLVHAPPHLLYIARSQEKLGHLVAARETYFSLVHEVIPESAPNAFREAQDEAKSELEELEKRIPSVTVNVEGGGDADLEVDGVSVGSGLSGIPYPVDPGTHKIRILTKTSASEEKSIAVSEGAHESLTLSLTVPLASTPPPTTNGAPEEKTPATDPSTKGAVEESSAKSSALRPALIYGGFGLGLVGLGVGTATGIMAITKTNQIKSDYNCNASGVCDAGGAEERKQVQPLELVSTIGFGVGIAGIGLGIVGLLLEEPKQEKPPTASLAPKFSLVLGETTGLSMNGAF